MAELERNGLDYLLSQPEIVAWLRLSEREKAAWLQSFEHEDDDDQTGRAE